MEDAPDETENVDTGHWDVEQFDPAAYPEPPVEHEEAPPEEAPNA
jgi:hypothetical protein